MMTRLFALLFASLLVTSAAGVASGDRAQDAERIVLHVDGADLTPAIAVAAAVSFPDDVEFIFQAPDGGWPSVSGLDIAVTFPGGAPTNCQAILYLKDRDDFWYQTRPAEILNPGGTTRLHFDLSPQSLEWEGRGHHAGWHFGCLIAPPLVGLRLFSSENYFGEVRIDEVLALPFTATHAPTIQRVQIESDSVPVYERLTLSCELPDRYRNPFNTNTVHLTATITDPDGSQVTVDGFYKRDYYRVTGHTGDLVMPQGRPYWQVRYAPRMEGVHTIRLHVRDHYGEAVWGPASFTATPPQTPGFIRVSREDPRFLEFDNGEPFFSIGYNIRSTFDTRVVRNFPWKHRWDDGTAAYARHFEKMRQYGLNMAEVWTAAWSLGLEWTPAWRGYHGIGDYNMIHAWELDRVIDGATEAGVYLNVVIHNHGKFSTFSDQEWNHNPHNIKNGGYLESPMAYFDDPRAFEDFCQLMRYKIARWGYSPHIFAWELVNELDLTGERGEGIPRNHLRDEVVDWHRRAGRFIADTDPNRHMVTTHYSGDYKVQNTNISALAEMDLCVVDAYHRNPDPLHVVTLMERTAAFNNPFRKPVLITEFGGSPSGNTLAHIIETLHAALWASPATATAGTPMLWWWHLVEEEHLYPMYAALARFMDGIDRRDPSLLPYTVDLKHQTDHEHGYRAVCMKSPVMALGWVFDAARFSRIDPATGEPEAQLAMTLRDMRSGRYRVEFWDTIEGTPVHRDWLHSDAGALVVPVAPFVRDVAFRISLDASAQSEIVTAD